MDQIILVNKEKGYTSRDVVNIISKALNTKKVGHFGTLDPLAEGLLIIGVESYTKLEKFIEDNTKEYIATVLIGVSTTTYDVTGTIIEKSSKTIKKEELEKALASFKTTYLQEVPIYSAVKVNGKKLYEYARLGKNIKLPKKSVTILDISLLSIHEDNNNNYFSFRCKVSKGTYIRSLINDISKKLDVPMCMSDLVRVKHGKFDISSSYTIEDIKNNNYKSLNIRDIVNLKEMEIPKELEKKVLNGARIERISDGKILFTKDGKDIALYDVDGDYMKTVLTLKNG